MAADDRGVEQPRAGWQDDDAWPDETGSYPPSWPVVGPTDGLWQQRTPGGSSMTQVHRIPRRARDGSAGVRSMR
eukprot:5202504-Alexandrium_andersonii.AAC.1